MSCTLLGVIRMCGYVYEIFIRHIGGHSEICKCLFLLSNDVLALSICILGIVFGKDLVRKFLHSLCQVHF
jgi:hypothetical protein